MAVRRKKVAEPEPEVEELDDELEDLEDIEDPEDEADEEVEEAPAPAAKRGRKAAPAKAAKKAAPAPKAAKSEYDTTWLVGHVNDTLGTEHDSRSLRMILRAMANNGDLARTVGEDRGRYEFKGANDPAVKKIVAHIKSKNATVPARKPKAEAAPAPAKKAPAKKAAKAAPRKRTRAAAE